MTKFETELSNLIPDFSKREIEELALEFSDPINTYFGDCYFWEGDYPHKFQEPEMPLELKIIELSPTKILQGAVRIFEYCNKMLPSEVKNKFKSGEESFPPETERRELGSEGCKQATIYSLERNLEAVATPDGSILNNLMAELCDDTSTVSCSNMPFVIAKCAADGLRLGIYDLAQLPNVDQFLSFCGDFRARYNKAGSGPMSHIGVSPFDDLSIAAGIGLWSGTVKTEKWAVRLLESFHDNGGILGRILNHCAAFPATHSGKLAAMPVNISDFNAVEAVIVAALTGVACDEKESIRFLCREFQDPVISILIGETDCGYVKCGKIEFLRNLIWMMKAPYSSDAINDALKNLGSQIGASQNIELFPVFLAAAEVCIANGQGAHELREATRLLTWSDLKPEHLNTDVLVLDQVAKLRATLILEGRIAFKRLLSRESEELIYAIGFMVWPDPHTIAAFALRAPEEVLKSDDSLLWDLEEEAGSGREINLAEQTRIDLHDRDAEESEDEKIFELIPQAAFEALKIVANEFPACSKEMVIELVVSDAYEFVLGQNFKQLNSPEIIEWAETKGLEEWLW